MSSCEADDMRLIEQCVTRIAEDAGGETPHIPSSHLSIAVDAIVRSGFDQAWKVAPPEIVGHRPNAFGMMIVRKRHQLVYSIKPSNFLRDPFVSAGATFMSIFAAAYMPAVQNNVPLTFPGFLIGLAFTVMRAFAHPVGYGEAALLHLMNQISETKGLVAPGDLKLAGMELVERYGYAKGNNTNEVQHLLLSLIAWKAIAQNEAGYFVKESVPFGLGPIEYVD